jgi:hypothetical protein
MFFRLMPGKSRLTNQERKHNENQFHLILEVSGSVTPVTLFAVPVLASSFASKALLWRQHLPVEIDAISEPVSMQQFDKCRLQGVYFVLVVARATRPLGIAV